MNSGRGGNNHRKSSFKRRDRNNDNWQDRWGDRRDAGRPGERPGETARPEKNRGGLYERPRWTPPKPPAEPLPVPNCPCCGKPINDLAAAISDKNSGEPAHFDCIIARIAERENLEPGDTVTYMGGGRFGIVHFNNLPENQRRAGNSRNFTVKKILEWEDKENRAEWRRVLSDYYSIT
ncbi:MAG: hypothetical protein LBK02_06165 [Treponema sp.]|jgi:hypothetical protein|nr:hypothetical protein [Treponema sp.]